MRFATKKKKKKENFIFMRIQLLIKKKKKSDCSFASFIVFFFAAVRLATQRMLKYWQSKTIFFVFILSIIFFCTPIHVHLNFLKHRKWMFFLKSHKSFYSFFFFRFFFAIILLLGVWCASCLFVRAVMP